MVSKMRIGFSGRHGGVLARALARRADVHDYDVSTPAAAFDVVLIDAGAKVGVDDQHRLSELIAAGVSVGWVNADAQALDAIAVAFGSRFERQKGLLMIASTEHEGSRWRRVEAVTGAPAKKRKARLATTDDAGATHFTDTELRPLSAHKMAELIAKAATRDWKAGLPQIPTNLIPPNGTVYSSTQYSNTYSVTLPASGWATGGSTSQSVTWSYNAIAYQYYENGNGANQYNVILISDFTAVPGTLASNSSGVRNWVQTQIQPSVTLTAAASNTVANLVHSPPASASPQSAAETVSVPMSFQIQGQPVAWTADYTNSYQTPDWALADQSNVGSGLTQWLFYETTLWNPTTNLPGDFGAWWGIMYDGNNNVQQFPTASLTTYNLEVASGWSVSGNPNNVGPLNVTYTFGISGGYYGFGNQDGTGTGHHQIIYLVDSNNNPILVGTTWPVMVDLVATT